MENIVDSIRDFYYESCGATDYELKLSGANISDSLKRNEETNEEFSSLLQSNNDGNLKRPLPAIIHPFRLKNFGIAVSFFNTGVSIFLLITPVTYYFINTLGANAVQVNAFITLVYLPWGMKFLFGILTDSVSILGFRRKSWMLIGWISYCFFNLFVTFFEKPGMAFITTVLFLSTASYLQADVCNDAQSIERSKFEPIELRGSYQTAMYTMRGFGMIVSSIQATLLYNTASFGWGLSLPQLFWLSVLIPATTVIPFTYFTIELKSKAPLPNFVDSVNKIWEVLQLKAVWYPLLFYLPYNCLQLTNSAWSNYLVLGIHFTFIYFASDNLNINQEIVLLLIEIGLNFSDFDLGLLTISASVAYFLVISFRVIFKLLEVYRIQFAIFVSSIP